jgi:hypothetical protein
MHSPVFFAVPRTDKYSLNFASTSVLNAYSSQAAT